MRAPAEMRPERPFDAVTSCHTRQARSHNHTYLGIYITGGPFAELSHGMIRAGRGNGRGFTLLEALVSIVIFGVGLSTFFGLFPYSLHQVRHSNIYLQAVSVGQQYMDAMRSAVEQSHPMPGPTSPAIDGGDEVLGTGHHNASPGNFTVTGSCANVAPYPRLQHCVVNVQWLEDGFTRTYSVESYATQQIS